MVGGAFARASAVSTARAAAVYFTLENRGSDAVRLVGLRTERARSAVLHQTVTVEDVTKMQDVAAIEIPPGGSLELQPGGSHVMLMGLAAPLKKGESFQMTLTFDGSGEMTVDIPVGGVAATAPE